MASQHPVDGFTLTVAIVFVAGMVVVAVLEATQLIGEGWMPTYFMAWAILWLALMALIGLAIAKIIWLDSRSRRRRRGVR